MIKQFHQVVVDRRAGGLDDEHVAAADVLVDLAGDFAVGEAADLRLAEGQAEIIADFFGQVRVGASGEDFQVVHCTLPPEAQTIPLARGYRIRAYKGDGVNAPAACAVFEVGWAECNESHHSSGYLWWDSLRSAHPTAFAHLCSRRRITFAFCTRSC